MGNPVQVVPAQPEESYIVENDPSTRSVKLFHPLDVDTEEGINTVVILGAGASHDAECDPERKPPLTRDLVDSLEDFENQRFPDSPVWRNLGNWRQRFKENFEVAMQELQQANDAFAGKLHARLGCFFASFEASKESLYCEMLRRMQCAGWKGAFVTFNYDTLLSQAAELMGVSLENPGVTQEGRENCFPTERVLSKQKRYMLFPNGASHLFPSGYRASSDMVFRPEHVLEASGAYTCPARQTDRRNIDPTVPRVMAYVEPGKTCRTAGLFVARQRKWVSQAIRNAHKVMIIGLSAPDPRADEDEQREFIWTDLKDTNAIVIYCNSNRQCNDFKQWADNQGKPFEPVPGYFRQSFECICEKLEV
jgi:hypothetical protein